MSGPTREQMASFRALCGWEIVCPDGCVRSLPYMNKGDAECDARVRDRDGCALLLKREPAEHPVHGFPVCPGPGHRIQARKSGEA